MKYVREKDGLTSTDSDEHNKYYLFVIFAKYVREKNGTSTDSNEHKYYGALGQQGTGQELRKCKSSRCAIMAPQWESPGGPPRRRSSCSSSSMDVAWPLRRCLGGRGESPCGARLLASRRASSPSGQRPPQLASAEAADEAAKPFAWLGPTRRTFACGR